jgi:hypothetical protein
MLRIDEDFKQHILQNYPLSHRDLEMLLDDLGEFFKRDYREYIRDRHLQLQKQNMKNDEIYQMIQGELPPAALFCAGIKHPPDSPDYIRLTA